MDTSPPTADGSALALRGAPPYDFWKALGQIELTEPMAGAGTVSEEAWRLALPVPGGGAALVEVRAVEGGVRVERLAGPEGALAALRPRLVRALGLERDPSAFLAVARRDAPFRELAGTLEGLPAVAPPSPWEAAAWFVLRRRQFPVVARARRREMVAAFGEAVPGAPAGTRAFPTPERLLGAGPDAVAATVRQRRRAAALVALADAWSAEAPGGDEAIAALDDDDLHAFLTGVRGVGPWTAGQVRAHGLARPRAADLLNPSGALTPLGREALARAYGPAGATPEALVERAAAYGDAQDLWLTHLLAAHRTLRAIERGGR